MTLDAWNVLASVGTFLVILATAIIALGQLRHIRRANQLSGMLSTFEMLQDPSVRALVDFVRHDLAVRMKDESFRKGLREVPIDRRAHPELYLCDMYNHVGSFVRSGLIDEQIYFQTDWYNVGLYWGLLKDVVAESRYGRPYIFENFEWLAVRAERWQAAHPDGDYPSTDRRMLVDS